MNGTSGLSAPGLQQGENATLRAMEPPLVIASPHYMTRPAGFRSFNSEAPAAGREGFLGPWFSWSWVQWDSVAESQWVASLPGSCRPIFSRSGYRPCWIRLGDRWEL